MEIHGNHGHSPLRDIHRTILRAQHNTCITTNMMQRATFSMNIQQAAYRKQRTTNSNST